MQILSVFEGSETLLLAICSRFAVQKDYILRVNVLQLQCKTTTVGR